ncbi:sugar-transfer associated ATP-grasp domain-containing protein [Nannocystis pusilla]|uniref:sugar-transfer associated ATP-grasp domain-containing protein n=1 Tax=Nannocystis pusilla TaxID=889268 RepID=UPI003BF2B588
MSDPTTNAPREHWWRRWQRARERLAPVFGMNRRNVELVYAHNDRRHYPLADDKILCKELLQRIGVPVAPTIAIGRGLFEVDAVLDILREREGFVVKPASGSGGDGIIVVGARTDNGWRTARGRDIAVHEMRQHLANITFGTFSKGLEDRLLIEERIEPHPLYHAFWPDGVCDLRIIVLRGRPLLSMVRVPTRRSGGRANLHQGGIGVAVDLHAGMTYRALSRGEAIELHPESGEPLIGRRLPKWDACIKVALGAASAVPLGYLGVDICVDRRWGPVVLEINARPGLEIQNICDRSLGEALRREGLS